MTGEFAPKQYDSSFLIANYCCKVITHTNKANNDYFKYCYINIEKNDVAKITDNPNFEIYFLHNLKCQI